MRDTIFSPSFGNRPTYLVGREAVIAALLDGLESAPGSRERATVLLGQRGSGKTVLLWELADRATEAGYVVATPTIVADGMLERIVEKVQDAGSAFATTDEARLSGGSVGVLGFSVGLEFTRSVQEEKSAEYKLTLLARRLTQQGLGLLILIDELQANSDEVRRIVGVYQELVGEGLNVAVVLAGLPGAVSATLNDRVLTFLNRANKMTLAPLSLGDVESYYQHAFAELGVTIDDDMIERAAVATAGSPYLMQLVGHNVVARANEGEPVGDRVLDAALRAARRDFENDVCQTTLAALSERDIDFLLAMSKDERRSRISELANRMRVSEDYAQKYRRRLIDAGVIEPAGRGYVRFAVPYLADYLREEE